MMKQKVWKALIEVKQVGLKNKNIVRRVLEILKKYVLFHMTKRWKKKANAETIVKEKNRIEGAYLLLKRFKTRFKALDETVKVINEKKAEKTDLDLLRLSMNPLRAEAVMQDMKILFDSTVVEFNKRLEAEKKIISDTYDRILAKQKNMVLAFEMKYANMLKQRMDRVENFTNDLAMEQAKLAAMTGSL